MSAHMALPVNAACPIARHHQNKIYSSFIYKDDDSEYRYLGRKKRNFLQCMRIKLQGWNPKLSSKASLEKMWERDCRRPEIMTVRQEEKLKDMCRYCSRRLFD